jgi:flagellar basal body-associated protein FliL
MVDVPATLVIALVAAFRLLALAAVVYVLWLLREVRHGLRKLQTDVEELRRELERSRK